MTSPDTAPVREFFNQLAGGWDESCVVVPGNIRAMLELAGIPAGARVLDVACGTGVMIPFLLERQPAALDAVDLSPAMVALAAKKQSHPSLRVFEADFYSLQSPAPYDALVVYNAFPHFMDKAAFARRAQSLLAPGGRLLIMHGAGRAVINGGHGGKKVSAVSTPLLAPAEEAARLPGFAFDILVDREHCYILSGCKL